MFRKPREDVKEGSEHFLGPSVGRPPTPPSSTKVKDLNAGLYNSSMTASKPMSYSGRALPKSTGRLNNLPGKSKGFSNGNILNFFKKTDSPLKQSPRTKEDEEGLFFQDDWVRQSPPQPVQTPTPPRDDNTSSIIEHPVGDNLPSQFNEYERSIKRRRIDNRVISSPSVDVDKEGLVVSFDGQDEDFHAIKKERIDVDFSIGNLVKDAASVPVGGTMNPPSKGPFVEDDESDDEMIQHLSNTALGSMLKVSPDVRLESQSISPKGESQEVVSEASIVPSLKRESTSINGVDDFDGIEDFNDDEFAEEGEEYLERRWMNEQQRLDMDSENEEGADEAVTGMDKTERDHGEEEAPPEVDSGSCPICKAAFNSISEEVASVHVNSCLDGKPIPLPKPTIPVKLDLQKLQGSSPSHKKFQRAAIARPGQENPFSVGTRESIQSTVFSKLMSSHAEDLAWATAAASETASRGKPAYQRTCPFYKILPGFFICVDAFRYGAVEGCKAYFLSHFHSDHYIGLTSSWCHGPIYCSHVTANLVRRQLRVDPKWVIDLEFDHTTEVPGTQGVTVTMIPANHCPGSSLYLFEKTIGKGKTPNVQRILHCGDFRACPAHIQHPLLRPDVIDTLTGKHTGQQKLDVCYLDTTYLTPKYAFPSQEEVIKACADMCVSLSKERVDEYDDWEQAKKERAGSGMVKFVQKESETIKEEDDFAIGHDSISPKTGKKGRGRLLVIVGTYSIGKERICLGVARALNSKIYAPPNKQRICEALEDPELTARLTNDPLEAQVHMQMLMEIRAETLADYLTGFKPHFSRIVGFRPSGWNYRPPKSRFVESPAVQTVLHSDNWKSSYSMKELVPQRGSTREANCFGVPYSEHSSFRELTMFVCALRIDKIVPTVNVGSAKSREKMKGWCEKWAMEKKKNGLYKVRDGQVTW